MDLMGKLTAESWVVSKVVMMAALRVDEKVAMMAVSMVVGMVVLMVEQLAPLKAVERAA